MSNNKYVPPHRRRSINQGETKFNTPIRTPRRFKEDDDERDYLQSHHDRTLQLAITKAYCINLSSRTDKWISFQRHARAVSRDFLERIERFDAIDGSLFTDDNNNDIHLKWDSTINAKYSPKETACIRTMLPGEVGCALSHIALWRRLVASDDSHWLILEDDCSFAKSQDGRDRFAMAFSRAWNELPLDWGLFYLGFSDRGERRYVNKCQHSPKHSNRLEPEIEVFSPKYGYHTHAYMITKTAAQTLLENLPVSGPIDVWLADHQWFGVPTYSAVIANEGWKREDGTYEGKTLVYQFRPENFLSDVSPGR